MSDEHDEYLWSGRGSASSDVATIERELRALAWTPRELALPAAPTPIPIARDDRSKPRAARAANDGRAWAPVLAALAAAAAVFAVIVWLRGPSDEPADDVRSRQPSIEPAGRPSPDLKDPFAGDTESPSFPTPSVAPDPKDHVTDAPETAPPRRVSPDLSDPFADSASAPDNTPPAPTKKRTPSPELADPFEGDVQPREPGKLYDPFTGKPADWSNKASPDLKDPFER